MTTSLLDPDPVAEAYAVSDEMLEAGTHDWCYWDEITGTPLDKAAVDAAMRKELEDYIRLGTHKVVSLDECWRVTGKAPVAARWKVINKGDESNPD
eukprot:1780418-Amphidinium_carterae.1